ncbi:hypothetical protein QCA50_019809 [Cerrena zonata]|uniref:Uncharacterized protein n=1 Tax=Cerrena zonata TaxID=2478898 RepID=A0AAW0FKN9_9APHY
MSSTSLSISSSSTRSSTTSRSSSLSNSLSASVTPSANSTISSSSTPSVSPTPSGNGTFPGGGQNGGGGGGGGGGFGGGNGGGQTLPSLSSSAALYLYTFLATLVLLLTVSGAIVIRSYIIRRNQREAIERAIRDGTYVPPSPGAGFGGRGRGKGKVDLSKKPGIWDVYLGDVGEGSNKGGIDEKSEVGEVRERDVGALGETAKDVQWWDGVMPVSAFYAHPPTSPDSENANLSNSQDLSNSQRGPFARLTRLTRIPRLPLPNITRFIPRHSRGGGQSTTDANTDIPLTITPNQNPPPSQEPSTSSAPTPHPPLSHSPSSHSLSSRNVSEETTAPLHLTFLIAMPSASTPSTSTRSNRSSTSTSSSSSSSSSVVDSKKPAISEPIKGDGHEEEEELPCIEIGTMLVRAPRVVLDGSVSGSMGQ